MDLSSGRFASPSNQNERAPGQMGPPPPPTASGSATRPFQRQPVPNSTGILRQALQQRLRQQSGVNNINGTLSAAMKKVIHCHEVQGRTNDEMKNALGDVLVEFSSMKIQLQQQHIKISQLEKKIQDQETSKQETLEEHCREVDNLNFQLQGKERTIRSLKAQKNTQLETLRVNFREANQQLREDAAAQTIKHEKLQNDYRFAVEQSHKKEMELMQTNAGQREQIITLQCNEKHLNQKLESEKARRVQVEFELEKEKAKTKKINDGIIRIIQKQQQQQHHHQQEILNFVKNIEDGNDAGAISAGAIAKNSKKRKMNTLSTSEERELTNEMARSQESNMKSVESSGSQTSTPGHGCDGDNDTTTSLGMDDMNDSDEYALQIVETDEQDDEGNIHAN